MNHANHIPFVQTRGRVMDETGLGSCRSFRWALPSTRNRVATRMCSPSPSVYRPSPVGSNIGRAIFSKRQEPHSSRLVMLQPRKAGNNTGEKSLCVDQKPAHLKTSHRSICVTNATCLCHAGDTAKGFGWLPVSRKTRCPAFGPLRACSERKRESETANPARGLLSATTGLKPKETLTQNP